MCRHTIIKMVVMEYFAGSESRLDDQNVDTEENEKSGPEPFDVDTLSKSDSLLVLNDEEIELEIAEISRCIFTFIGQNLVEKSNKFLILTSFYFRLQQLVPTMSAKDNVTQLDIILEAIRYIDSLRDKLEDKIDNGDIVTEASKEK